MKFQLFELIVAYLLKDNFSVLMILPGEVLTDTFQS